MGEREGDRKKHQHEGKIRKGGGCASALGADKDHTGEKRRWRGMPQSAQVNFLQAVQ